MKKINFCSGPAIQDSSVIANAGKALIDFNNTGLSLLEISHRSTEFVEVMEKTKQLVKELLNVNDDYEVLFLHGGASLQFCMIPFNLLDDSGHALYSITGQWASNALKEAQLFGKATAIHDSSDKNFNYIPTIEWEDSYNSASYLHITSNNTIYGTQWSTLPTVGIPLIADMSSDIFSRKIKVSDFDLIYAGAQKNMGPAGVCMVIIKKEILGKVNRKIPTMLDYQTHITHKSMFNTPPVFAIYTSMLTLEWLKSIGGIEYIEKVNEEKARLLYAELDKNALFEPMVQGKDRSLMNITFRGKDENIEKKFKEVCKENGVVGLDGYRTVGGFRASIYNAMSIEKVSIFVSLLQDFEAKHG